MNRENNRSDRNNSGQREKAAATRGNPHKGGDVSNRGKEGHHKDDSSRGAERNTTKKGSNSV